MAAGAMEELLRLKNNLERDIKEEDYTGALEILKELDRTKITIEALEVIPPQQSHLPSVPF